MGKIANAIRGTTLALDKKAEMLALDDEFVSLEKKVQTLETENLQLRAEVNPLKREVDRLKNQVEQKKTPVHTLDEAEIEMLKALAAARRGLRSQEFQEKLRMHPARVEHFLNLLIQKEYILAILAMGGNARYELDHKGNEYLVKNNLV